MATQDITKIPAPRTPLIDEVSGDMTPAWYRFFYNLFGFTGSGGDGGVPVNRGGTGQTSYTDGQLLIGNSIGNTLSKNTLTPGTGIGVTNGHGTIEIDNTGVLSISGGSTGLTPNSPTVGNVVLAGVLNETHGGTNQSTYAAGDILYANGVNTLTKLAKPSASAYLVMNNSGVPSWKIPAYGAFYDTGTYTIAANTPTAISYSNTSYSNNVSIGTTTSHIDMATAGLYNLAFSIQFANANAADDDVVVWIKVNGNNVADTASWISVPGKHAGVNGTAILTVNFFYQFTAGQYFELYWMNLAGNAFIQTLPASVTPSYPVSPAIVLTVSDNIAA